MERTTGTEGFRFWNVLLFIITKSLLPGVDAPVRRQEITEIESVEGVDELLL